MASRGELPMEGLFEATLAHYPYQQEQAHLRILDRLLVRRSVRWLHRRHQPLLRQGQINPL